MARIKVDEVVDELSSEFKKALAATIDSEIPGANYDISRLFKTFSNEIYRKCSDWEKVPDGAVEKD